MRWLIAAASPLLDLLILGLALYARTSQPLVSPWDVLPTWVFALFALSTAFLAYSVTQTLPKAFRISSFVLHSAVVCWTAALIYQFGFGFDPFIHQAAEQHLANYGTITLKTPLYIGQYGLVWLLHAATRIPIVSIDQWLVPIATLCLMLLLYHTQRFLPLAFFLLPVSFFSFTIPFHLGVLLFLAIMLLARETPTKNTSLALITCALISLFIHPLIGVPCCMFVIATLLQTTKWSKHTTLIIAVGIPLALFAAMTVYATSQHASLSLPSVKQIHTSLVILFGTTYRVSLEQIGLSALYGFVSLWPFAVCLLGIREHLRTKTPWGDLRLYCAIGLVVAAVLLACFIRLPDIIAHEQFEFPFRLLHLVLFLFLPDIACLLERITTGKTPHRKLVRCFTYSAIGIIASTQWFISYPQHNAIAHTYAPSMSVYEYEALKWIETQTAGAPFVVLSHQMLSAAALQTRGFEQEITTCHGTHLRYAIPTGGALYQDFLNLVRSRTPSRAIEKLKACYGNAQLMIIIPGYWDPEGRIDVTLKPLSKQTENFGDFLRGYVIK